MNKGLKDKIIKLYFQGKNYTEIATLLTCSKGTISYHLNSYKEKDRAEAILIKNAQKIKDKQDKLDKKLAKAKLSYVSNSAEYYRYRRQVIKTELIQYKGGKCELCGYDKCISALEFHHRNPSIKEFSICTNMKNLKLDAVKEELSKCNLLCANCHREVHENLLPKLMSN